MPICFLTRDGKYVDSNGMEGGENLGACGEGRSWSECIGWKISISIKENLKWEQREWEREKTEHGYLFHALSFILWSYNNICCN